MSYNNWPDRVGGNLFFLAKLDPESPPASMKVVTWSDVFRDGGSVTIEAYDDEGKRYGGNFGSISIKSIRSVCDERDHLQDLLDDFLDDLPGNWRALIGEARAGIEDYYTKQAKEFADKAARAKKGDFS